MINIELETATDTTSDLLLKEVDTTRTAEEFNIQLESNTVLNGPYYVFAMNETKVNGKQQLSGGIAKHYYYPLFLTQGLVAMVLIILTHLNLWSFLVLLFICQLQKETMHYHHLHINQFNSEDYISYPVLENDKIILDRTDVSQCKCYRKNYIR